jgi:DNA-binding LacI/PurR family transcriptional regulator
LHGGSKSLQSLRAQPKVPWPGRGGRAVYGGGVAALPSRRARARRPTTLASLAAELGISRTTVSNAYNRPDQLSPELRERVLDAARRVGYPGPDPVARSLRIRQAGAIGLIFTEALSYAFRDPGAVAFLEGLALACEQAGAGLLLVPAAPGGAPDPQIVHRAAVDGFVVYSMPDDDPHLAAVLQRPAPTVIVDEPVGIPGVDWVGLDDEGAAAEVGRHLAALGHRRVGVVAGRLDADRNDGPASVSRQRRARYAVERARLAGLARGLVVGGIDWREVPVEERFDNSVAAGASAADALLDRHPDLTALACTTDVFALAAIGAARRRGLRVPDDLSVTGFDDVPDAAAAGLTTIHQPTLEKGRVAGHLLLDEGDRPAARRVLLPTELLVRRSTAPPRTGSGQPTEQLRSRRSRVDRSAGETASR